MPKNCVYVNIRGVRTREMKVSKNQKTKSGQNMIIFWFWLFGHMSLTGSQPLIFKSPCLFGLKSE